MNNSSIAPVVEKSIMTSENLNTANALLALLHGKSDSICKLFGKEISVGKGDLKTLNEMMIEKLSLHNVVAEATTITISFNSKKVLSFKTWDEFEKYDFSTINAITKSIFMQWDFFVNIFGYELPQRHTVSVRISSTPNPSDFLKALINGGFDDENELDMQTCTMICKVDFINNVLAEELTNVASRWNDLCEPAISKKGVLKSFLFKNRKVLSDIFNICMVSTFFILAAIILKILINNNVFSLSIKLLFFICIFIMPLYNISKIVSNSWTNKLYSQLGDIIDIHIFSISKGDEKERERIEKSDKSIHCLFSFAANTLVTIIVSFIFFYIS